MKLESIEDDFPAIKQIDASYHKQQMTVEYDEQPVPLRRAHLREIKAGQVTNPMRPASDSETPRTRWGDA